MLPRECHDLTGLRDACLAELGPRDRVTVRGERVRECSIIGREACERDRLVAEGEPLDIRSLDRHGDRRTREQPRPDRRIGVTERVERFSQELDLRGVERWNLEPAGAGPTTQRGPGQAIGPVVLPSQLCSLVECTSSPREIAGRDMGVAELQQEISLVRGIGWTERERLQRMLEMVHCRFVREHRHRAAARFFGVRDRLGRVASRRGLAEVMRELGGINLATPLANPFERLRDLFVQPHAPCETELAIGRFTYQRMGECEPSASRFAHESRRLGFVEHLQQRDLVESRRLVHELHAELHTDDRRNAERVTAWRGNGVETPGERRTDALGKRQLGDRIAVERSLGIEEADDFTRKERVTGRQHMQPRNKLVGDRAADKIGNEHAELTALQRRDGELLSVPDKIGQRRCEIRRARYLVVAVRRENDDRGIAQERCEKREQPDRGRIGPVQVVDDQESGLLRGEYAEGVRQRREQTEARQLVIRVLGRAVGGNVERVGAELDEQLRPGPKRGRAGFGPTRDSVCVDAARGRECDRFFGKARLPGTRLADDEQQSSASDRKGFNVRAQLSHLTLTADEHAASVEAPLRAVVSGNVARSSELVR